MCPTGSLLLLPEHLECEWQKFGCDALAGIAHMNHPAVVLSRERDGDLATGGSEFQRVEQHVPEDLLQAIPVGAHAHRLGASDEPHSDVFRPGTLGCRFY